MTDAEDKNSSPSPLIYFDHSVLDRMRKGTEAKVSRYIEAASLTPVWSDENIREIAKSQGSEDSFCDLLNRLGALRINEEMVDFEHTGRVIAHSYDPIDRLRELRECDSSNDSAGSMKGFLEKVFGGRVSESFVDLLAKPHQSVAAILNDLEIERGDSRILALRKRLSDNVDLIDALEKMGGELDAKALHGPLLEQMEQHIGAGTVQLNNIKPPDVVQKIWEVVGPSLGAPETKLEVYFGLEPIPGNDSASVPSLRSGKVSAIYHRLNTLGYWPDSHMSKLRRFNASDSDMTHAGMASYATVFLCNDKPLRLKAKAAYEFLQIPLLVCAVSEGV